MQTSVLNPPSNGVSNWPGCIHQRKYVSTKHGTMMRFMANLRLTSCSCGGEVRVNDTRIRAYRILLAQGLLHLKWDLADFYGGLSLSRPWRLLRQSRLVRLAACRAFAFHNLAIFAANDFADFSEEKFWEDIGRFRRDFPDALCPYRDIFEQCLRGEPVSILASSG